MINRINTIIEVNLQILYKAENNFLNLNDFKDDFGKQFQDPNAFVRLLRIKKLVIRPYEDKSCFQLSEFGKEICENGGWLDYLKKQNKTAKQKRVEEKIEPKKTKNGLHLVYDNYRILCSGM
jgi:hypothetical protein